MEGPGFRPAGRAEGAERALSRLTFLLPLLAYVVVYFIDRSQFHPSGDGYYSWMFARSIAFDGDIDFRNDYAICGDPMKVGLDRGTGHVDNPFYAGPAVFWVPQLVVLRGIFTLLYGAERAATASCLGWMPALTILAGPICGALTVWFAYRAARLLVPASVAAFASLFFAFSSPIFPYSTSVAHYSHVYLAFTVAVVAFIALRMLLQGPRPRDTLWIGLALAVAVLHRLPAALYAAVPGAVFLAPRIAARVRSSLAVAIAFGASAGIALTCLVFRYLYGKWFAVPQGPYYMQWNHAHPWLLLFGVHGGFFFWMPAAWFALPGLLLAVRRPRMGLFVLACIAASAVEVFISSAPLDWNAQWTLGARRLLPLVPFVIVFAAIAIDGVSTWLGRRFRAVPQRWLAIALVALVLVNNIPASTTIRGDKELTQRELYGAVSPFRPLWSALDRAGIDIALLPAELYVQARYGLPLRSYRDLTAPRYRRRYRDLVFYPNAELDLRQAWAASVVRGAEWSERGVTVTRNDAHLVFTAEWPLATRVRFLVTSPDGSRLRMAVGGAFGVRRQIGSAFVPRGSEPSWFDFDLPPGAFDSGVCEWILGSEGGTLVIEKIEIVDGVLREQYGDLGVDSGRSVVLTEEGANGDLDRVERLRADRRSTGGAERDQVPIGCMPMNRQGLRVGIEDPVVWDFGAPVHLELVDQVGLRVRGR